MTTLKASSWSAWATRFDSIPSSWPSPNTTASSRGRWPSPAGIRRVGSNGKSTCVRKSFFAARKFVDVADLNAQACDWCAGRAFDRPWPQDDSLTVRQAFAVEQHCLLGLPAAGYALGQRLDVAVAKTPWDP